MLAFWSASTKVKTFRLAWNFKVILSTNQGHQFFFHPTLVFSSIPYISSSIFDPLIRNLKKPLFSPISSTDSRENKNKHESLITCCFFHHLFYDLCPGSDYRRHQNTISCVHNRVHHRVGGQRRRRPTIHFTNGIQFFFLLNSILATPSAYEGRYAGWNNPFSFLCLVFFSMQIAEI